MASFLLFLLICATVGLFVFCIKLFFFDKRASKIGVLILLILGEAVLIFLIYIEVHPYKLVTKTYSITKEPKKFARLDSIALISSIPKIYKISQFDEKDRMITKREEQLLHKHYGRVLAEAISLSFREKRDSTQITLISFDEMLNNKKYVQWLSQKYSVRASKYKLPLIPVKPESENAAASILGVDAVFTLESRFSVALVPVSKLISSVPILSFLVEGKWSGYVESKAFLTDKTGKILWEAGILGKSGLQETSLKKTDIFGDTYSTLSGKKANILILTAIMDASVTFVTQFFSDYDSSVQDSKAKIKRLMSRTMDSGEAFVLTLIDISLLDFIIRKPSLKKYHEWSESG